MKRLIALGLSAVIMLATCNSVFAEARKLIAENNVNLVGNLVVAEDEGNDGMVKYRAIRLIQPVIIIHDDGETEADTVTLWLKDKKQEAVFNRLKGKRVQAVGTLHYYSHGPSAMPNPAKLEVINMYQ
jgi:hypothetical protein